MKELARFGRSPNLFDLEVAFKNGECDRFGRFLGELSRRTRRRLALESIERGRNSLNSVAYAPGPSTADTNRGPSMAIWGNCPFADFQENADLGMTFWDDFTMTGVSPEQYAAPVVTSSWGQWSITQAGSATILDAQLEGGIIGCSGANSQMSSSAGSFRLASALVTPTYGQKLWFECRMGKVDVTTAHIGMFMGLLALATPGIPVNAIPIATLTNLGTLSSTNDFIGFFASGTSAISGLTDTAFVTNLAGKTAAAQTGMSTLAANTGNPVWSTAALSQTSFHKFGFLFDPQGPYARATTVTANQTLGTVYRKVIRPFMDGLENPTFLTSIDLTSTNFPFPISFLYPYVQLGFASTATGYFDWIRVAQKAVA